MKAQPQHQPPAWARRFVEWYCKPELAEDLTGDLHEYFERNVQAVGPFRAKLIYIADTLKFLRPYTIRKPDFFNFSDSRIMIGSYVKTSVRNVSRNKLFSAINIAGLAIAMSVGLLLIAFAHDLMRYDRYNEKGNRIFRITSHAKFREGYSDRFATTSVRAGKLIADRVPGVEETAILRTEFSGDARMGDNTVPVSGIYAEPSALRIFTMPLLRGNAQTALAQPNSVVLTETTARKLFGNSDAFGKTIHFDSIDLQVTGIMKDVPFFSHLKFESLISFNTIESRMNNDPDFMAWTDVWQRNYVYVQIPEDVSAADIQARLNALCAAENRDGDKAQITLSLLPLYDIVLGENLSNSIGPVVPRIVLWIVVGLALIVILSACFNYTNLSIARSMRRFREIGLRKVVGAGRGQVRLQFLVEATVVSLSALLLSVGIFMLLRPHFLGIAPELMSIVKLELTLPMLAMFLGFALVVGILAGFLPALFFAKVSAMNALGDISSVRLFGQLSVRRALVIVQYSVTLVFITCTFIGYKQYKNILAFDLGFSTENILNISLQKNKPEVLINKLKALPEVEGVSQSRLLTSVGNAWGGYLKYQSPRDSAVVLTNIVDEHYLPLHRYKLIAGGNFKARPQTYEATSEVVVNEKTLRQFNIGNGKPAEAVGEEILLNNKRLTIVGVMKDFHYGKLDSDIPPVVLTFLTPDAFLTADKRDGLINVLVNTTSPAETMARIEEVWKSVDPVHPMEAQFYDDSIEEAYSDLSAMIKVIGFLSFIAISIASLGLLGMVVFTTETRMREISVRKVLGASSGSLVLLLSRGFFVLLGVSGLFALPVSYLLFDRFVLTKFPFHESIGVPELFGGFVTVLLLALVMIGSQTVRAARSNPAEVLKGE